MSWNNAQFLGLLILVRFDDGSTYFVQEEDLRDYHKEKYEAFVKSRHMSGVSRNSLQYNSSPNPSTWNWANCELIDWAPEIKLENSTFVDGVGQFKEVVKANAPLLYIQFLEAMQNRVVVA